MQKNTFANLVVAVCMVAGAVVTAAVLVSYFRLSLPLPSECIEKLELFWGGELLILALRQVIGSDCLKKKTDSGQSESDGTSITDTAQRMLDICKSIEEFIPQTDAACADEDESESV